MKLSFKFLKKKLIKLSDVPLYIKEVYLEKADAICLCVFSKESTASFSYDMEHGLYSNKTLKEKYSIKLYNGKTGLIPTARISYLIQNDGRCYISSFVTEKAYQSSGFGRYIYELALAHVDNMGCNESYGLIAPIGEIKELSNRHTYNERDQIDFLVDAYKSLGNTINQLLNDMMEYEFSSTWFPHERIELLNNEQKDFLYTQIDQQTNEM
jgi:hypothetical protein